MCVWSTRRYAYRIQNSTDSTRLHGAAPLRNTDPCYAEHDQRCTTLHPVTSVAGAFCRRNAQQRAVHSHCQRYVFHTSPLHVTFTKITSVLAYKTSCIRQPFVHPHRLHPRLLFCPTDRPSFQPSVRPSVRSFVRPSVRLSVRPSVCPSVRSSVRSSVRRYVRPYVRQSVRLSVRPSTHPSVPRKTLHRAVERVYTILLLLSEWTSW